MHPRFWFFGTLFIILIAIDIYAFQAVKSISNGYASFTKKIIYTTYWLFTLVLFLSITSYLIGWYELLSKTLQTFIRAGLFIIYFSKIFLVCFVIIDDIIRLFTWSYQKISLLFNQGETISSSGNKITRSDFLMKTGIIVASIPLTAMTWGIASGAYDYRIRKRTISLPNLPKAFDGIRIVQLSDIHSGSFYNKKAVMGGIEMAMNEKPDIIFFTGDLVNNDSHEVEDYINVFDKVKAPLGVYSILGNHDYGDYKQWSSPKAKIKNLEDLKDAHKLLGWDLLLNENRIIEQGGDKLAIIGIENWSAVGNFQKYGKIDQAVIGTEECSTKLLLTHDPSQWEAQVLKNHKDIDISFAGHTHGMQFGVEIGNFRWSPVQYVYKQWADLYQEHSQYLYVNRGFGFIGYPGRVGILPEITVMELKRA